MPATIYDPPEEIGDPPEIDYRRREGQTIDEMLAPEREWEESLKTWCRDHGSGELRGEEYRYPMGDGCARYIVFKHRPLTLIHVTTGDAWDIPEVVRKGLDLAEIRAHVQRSRNLASIFGGSR